MKNLRKGFTLVELIVVITILAILGTIAFISLQGYSSDARNSKRTSDLGSIESAIATQLAEGQSIFSFTTGLAANQISSPSVAGTASIVNTDYNAGPVNYTALPVKSTDFQDPNGNSYVIGLTTRKNGKHELAASMEQGAGSRIAKIIGDYSKRAQAYIAVLTGSTTGVVTISGSTDINKFFPGDWVTTNGTSPVTTTIIRISPDGKTITLSGSVNATATGIQLAAAESDGLIDGVSNTGVVSDGGSTYLPY